MTAPDRFELTREERDSSLWKKLDKHLNERLDIARRQNDLDSSVEATAKLRGRIQELKSFIALGREEATDREAG